MNTQFITNTDMKAIFNNFSFNKTIQNRIGGGSEGEIFKAKVRARNPRKKMYEKKKFCVKLSKPYNLNNAAGIHEYNNDIKVIREGLKYMGRIPKSVIIPYEVHCEVNESNKTGSILQLMELDIPIY